MNTQPLRRIASQSSVRAAIVAAVGLVRLAVDLRFEPVEDSAYDRGANRVKLFLRPSHLAEICTPSAYDQKDRIDDTCEEQRIISCQNGRRIQEYDAEFLGK